MIRFLYLCIGQRGALIHNCIAYLLFFLLQNNIDTILKYPSFSSTILFKETTCPYVYTWHFTSARVMQNKYHVINLGFCWHETISLLKGCRDLKKRLKTLCSSTYWCTLIWEVLQVQFRLAQCLHLWTRGLNIIMSLSTQVYQMVLGNLWVILFQCYIRIYINFISSVLFWNYFILFFLISFYFISFQFILVYFILSYFILPFFYMLFHYLMLYLIYIILYLIF